MSTPRVLLVVGSLGLLALAFWWRGSTSPAADEMPHLTYVATAHQLGVVGYRDPVGVIDPSGSHIAYTEGRRLRVAPVQGGMSLVTPEAEGQIRHLAWMGTTGEVIVDGIEAGKRWWVFTPGIGRKRPLWEGREAFEATSASPEDRGHVEINALRQLAVSPDGRWVAALANGSEGAELWRIAIDGSRAEKQRITGAPSAPTWSSASEIACIVTRDGRPRLTMPCGGEGLVFSPDVDVVGPIAFAPTGSSLYFASPNGGAGTVDLWTADRTTHRARPLTSFGRDSYAPSVASDGTVLFKTQSYRTHVAEIDLDSGQARQLTAFQAETPFYDPQGRKLSVTYGTWRRVMDDANYPDIAQEIGLIESGSTAGLAEEPMTIIANSTSEDQAMAWSPNGKWMALHSHREQSDDIWLRPSDRSAPDRRITFLGRGAEVGWPRWSHDGTKVLLDGASPKDGRSVLFVIGVDQVSGATNTELREIPVDGFAGEITHAEWRPDNRTVVAIGKEGPGRHVIVEVPIAGGAPRIVHRFESEHDFPGLAVSPDGRDVAFIAPADDGFFQIFRMPLTGGPVVRVTTDPSHKTQPAWSPDGNRIAFTVWSYDAQFWRIR